MISIESSVTSPFWTPILLVAMVQLGVPSGNPRDALSDAHALRTQMAGATFFDPPIEDVKDVKFQIRVR